MHEKLKYILSELIIQNYYKSEKFNNRIVIQMPSGGHENLYFKSFNIIEENLDDACKAVLNEFFSEIKSAIISTAYRVFLKYLVCTNSNDPQYHPGFMQSLISTEAEQINQSMQSEEFYIEVTLLTELDRGFKLPTWERRIFDVVEMTLKAHQSGIDGSEFLSRMFYSSTFKRPLNLFSNQTKNGVVQEVEEFVLSLSLGLKRPIALDDISVIPKYWINSGSYPFLYERMWGYWYGSGRDSSASKFWSQSIQGGATFMQPESDTDAQKCHKWMVLLASTPGAMYPLNMIIRGVWQIFSSSNSPSYLSKKICISGITDILHGMEGLTRKSNLAHDGQPRKKFQQSWRKIIDTSPAYITAGRYLLPR